MPSHNPDSADGLDKLETRLSLIKHLIKKRPQVGLRAPTVIRPGSDFEVELILEVERELPTDAVIVELHGSLLSGVAQNRSRQGFRKQVARVTGSTVLPSGTHRRRVRFRLPENSPSSYSGVFIDIEYTIEVRLEIPWWPDRRVTFPLQVRALNDPHEGDGPRVFVPTLDGASRGEAHFELSLGSHIVEPGGKLSGALAVANVHARRYRGFEVELLVTESQPSRGFNYGYKKRRWVIESDPRLAQSGATMPFRLTMPDDLCPAFSLGDLRVSYALNVRLRVAWSRDLSIRLPIQVRDTDSAQGELSPVPVAVGDARASAMWREAAERAEWTFGPGGVLSSRVAGYKVQVSRRDEGRHRALVHVDIPDLAIGVEWTPGRGRGFSCRDEALRMHLCRGMDEALRAFEVLDASDKHLLLAAGGSALEAAEVLDVLKNSAEAIPAVYEVLSSLPPASNWEENAEDFESLAAALGARCEPHACRVVGQYFGVPFSIVVQDDVRILRVHVDPSFTKRESVLLVGDEIEEADRPELAGWSDKITAYERAGNECRLELGSLDGLDHFPTGLATQVLDPLARRRRGSLGGYR